MPSIVITGVTGLRNRGVEALVRPTIERLQALLPSHSIDVMTDSPDYDQRRFPRANVTYVPMLQRPGTSSGKAALINKGKQAIKKILGKPTGVQVPEVIKRASLVIVTGGDCYSSDYGMPNLLRHLYPLQLALRENVPLFFLAQSIGPFKAQAEINAFVEVGAKARMITVREKISYDYLTKTLNLPQSIVRHTADPGLLLAPSAERQKVIREHYGINGQQPTIGLSISQGICSWTGSDFDRHVDVWQKLILAIIEKINANVVIVPHVQEVWADTDDRVISTRVLEKLNYHPSVRLVGGDHSAADFKAVLGGCDLVVAERMHAGVGAMSQAVPTLLVGYSIKSKGVLQDLMGESAPLTDQLISIQDFLDAPKTIDAFQRAWASREQMRAMLTENLPAAKASADSNFDMIADMVGSR